MKLNKKGFTLVEILAVIVILGLLMTIALVGVSDYITKSRRTTYITTAKQMMNAVSTMIAKNELVVRDTNAVYYIHVNNISTEKKTLKSPYGQWVDAYVVVTILPDTNEFVYYWTSVDDKGYRVDLTEEAKLDEDDIYVTDNKKINNSYPLGGRDKIVLYDKDGNRTTDEPSVEITLSEAEDCYDWTEESNGEITITSYKRSCGLNVSLPSVIAGKPVTIIGEGAFKNLGITSVTFYKGIKEIGYGAFQGNNLDTVKLSQTIKKIGDYAFYGSKVSNLIMSEGLESVGSYSFASNKICKISFPASLKSIGGSAFANNCLDNISVPAGTTIGSGAFTSNGLSSDKAFIYKKNSDGTNNFSSIIGYAGGAKKDLSIPSTKNGMALLRIESQALKSASLSGFITIPDTVTYIGSDAFAYNSITGVKLSNSLVKLESGAFRGNQITSISIPPSVTSISTAFNNNKVTGDDAFIYARNSDGSVNYEILVGYAGGSKTGITELTVPAVRNGKTLKEIRSGALGEIYLKKIHLPSLSEVPNITIASGAFNHNNFVTDFQTEYNNGPFIYEVNNGVVNYKTITSYAGPSSGVNGVITIPQTYKGYDVETIRASFTWKSYDKIIIPASVKTMSNGIFGKGGSNNQKLKTIVNKTGREFNWKALTSSSYVNTFVTGIIKHQAGDIEVVSS